MTPDLFSAVPASAYDRGPHFDDCGRFVHWCEEPRCRAWGAHGSGCDLLRHAAAARAKEGRRRPMARALVLRPPCSGRGWTMNPALTAAVRRRYLAMWPLSKILADLAGTADAGDIANAVRVAMTGGLS